MEVIGFKDLGEVNKRLYLSKFILSNGEEFYVRWHFPEIWNTENGNYVRDMRWARDKTSLVKHGLSKDEIKKFQMDAIQGRWRKAS